MTTPTLTTGTVNEVKVLVQGDIGGVGVSRWRFIRNDAGVTTVADCNAAGAAVKAFYSSAQNYPSAITFAVQATVEMFDIGSGLVQGSLVMTTVPAVVPGGAGGAYAAGTGLRINWKTSQIVGRRLLRGATFLVPTGSTAFASNGAVATTYQATVQSAATAYVAAMQTANLVPVVWHRPPVHTTSGGVVGVITGGTVSGTPAGLRSRRS
jgi:hypothetical protein